MVAEVETAEAGPGEAEPRLPALREDEGGFDGFLLGEALAIGRVGVWAWDLQDGTVSLDRVAHRLWGLEGGAPATLSDLVAAIHPDDLGAVRRAVAITRETGRDCHVVFRLRRPGGDERWMRVRARRRRVPAGDLIVGVTIDVTERKRTEAALSATQERLRRAQELGGAHPFEWDAGADEIVAGQDFKALYALGPEDRLDLATFLARIHPADRDRVAADQSRLMAEPGPYEAEFRLLLPDGAERWILSRGVSVVGPSGAPAGIAGINMDVTARKQVEEELDRSRREGQARLRELTALYQNAPVGLALLDPDLRFLRVNEFMASLDGTPVEAHLGRGLFEILPHLRPVLDGVLRDVLARGEPVRNVEALEGSGSDRRAWRFHFHPLAEEGGSPAGLGIVAEDVTEHRRAERSRDLLSRELNHRIKNLFAVVSSLISLSARGQDGLQAFARTVRGRVEALGRAHDCVRPTEWGRAPAAPASLHGLLRTLLAPYGGEDDGRVRISGEDAPVGASAATALALAVHEFATNAAKYGSLSANLGAITLATRREGDDLVLVWTERGGPALDGPPRSEGFGSTLARRSLGGDLGAAIVTDWAREGLEIRARLPLERLAR